MRSNGIKVANDCPVDPPQVPDPCDKANELEGSTPFKSKMLDLKSRTTESYESAYLMKDDNDPSPFTYINGGPNGTDFNFNSSFFDHSTGFIHNHEDDPDNLSTFSYEDFKTLYAIQQNPTIVDKQNYTFGMVSAEGVTYALVIDDMIKFNAFCGNIPSLNSAFNSVFNIYVKANNTIEQNESGLLNFLSTTNGGTGLSLLKGDASTFNNWGKMTKDSNGNIVIVNCN